MISEHSALSLHPSLCSSDTINLNPAHLSKAVIQLDYSSRPHQHPTSYQPQVPDCKRLNSVLRAAGFGFNQPFATVGRPRLSLSRARSRGLTSPALVSRARSAWIIVKHVTVEPNATHSHTGRLLLCCPLI